MRRRDLLTGSIATVAAALGASAKPPWSVPSAQSEPLRAVANTKGTLVGAEISNRQIRDARLSAFITTEFNIVAADSQMQWNQVHPEPDRYDFSETDELIAFAKNHSLPVHGRPLCQNLNLPPWVAKETTPDNAAQLLREHVTSMVSRYAGQIHSWDVLSNAIEPPDNRDDGMRNSLWMKLLGLNYIATAFRAAAETDHKAILTYSEGALVDDSENSHHRRLIALGFLRWFRANHIPIHALALESHLWARYDYLPNWVGLHAFLREVEKLELQVFITGLEIDDTDLATKTGTHDKQVAELCKDYLDNVLKHRNVEVVLTSSPVSHPAEIVNDFGETEKRHIAAPLNEDCQPTTFLSAMNEAIRKRRTTAR
jgi:endo-1,4-beta-xylanase